MYVTTRNSRDFGSLATVFLYNIRSIDKANIIVTIIRERKNNLPSSIAVIIFPNSCDDAKELL